MAVGRGGGAAVAHRPESGLKQPETNVVLDVDPVKAVASVGVETRSAWRVPGSMDGPPGRQPASPGYCLK